MTKQQTFNIKGMHCASCASIIEKTLKEESGVSLVEVNFGTETAKVSFDESRVTPEHLSKKIEPLGYSIMHEPTAAEMGMSPSEHAAHTGLGQTKQQKLLELAEMKTKLLSAVPLAAISFLVMGWELGVQLHWLSPMSAFWASLFRILMPLMATYVLFVIGKPYLLGVYRFARYGKANMDTLIGIGTTVAYIYSVGLLAFADSLRPFLDVTQSYFDVTIVVLTFITLGKYLEAQAKLKTGDAIEKLLNLQAKTALVIKNNREVSIPIEQVVHGDLIIVKPGARIPIDGKITEGSSFLDEAMVTGESMPIEKSIGDLVIGGTINTTGSFTFEATRVGSETLLAQIVHMVQEAQGSKAPIQALADTISGVFVPIVLVLAIVALVAWIVFGTPGLGFSHAVSLGLTSFVGILVIACPCALGLATPTAIIVGVGKGAKEGILIKDAATLEKLYKVNTVVIDKTGTITKGKPELVSLKNLSSQTDAEILTVLSSLEQKSEHPISHAIVDYALKQKIKPSTVQNFESIKGKGIRGVVDGKTYLAGNVALIADQKFTFDSKQLEQDTLTGKTPVILANDHIVLAVAMVADAIKPEAIEAVKDLHQLGINVVMLTGDDKNTAQ
ncbi:MAG: heavy metal translocating P-type ATPase, partial [Chitinophagales bacterium]